MSANKKKSGDARVTEIDGLLAVLRKHDVRSFSMEGDKLLVSFAPKPVQRAEAEGRGPETAVQAALEQAAAQDEQEVFYSAGG